MATTPIPDLAAKTAPVAADLVIIADSEASNATRKATLANLAKGMQASAVADLNQTISSTYSRSQVQAISDKVDALLAALRAANLLAP